MLLNTLNRPPTITSSDVFKDANFVCGTNFERTPINVWHRYIPGQRTWLKKGHYMCVKKNVKGRERRQKCVQHCMCVNQCATCWYIIYKHNKCLEALCMRGNACVWLCTSQWGRNWCKDMCRNQCVCVCMWGCRVTLWGSQFYKVYSPLLNFSLHAIAELHATWLDVKPLSFFIFISFSAVHSSIAPPPPSLLAFLFISFSLARLCSFLPLPLCLAVKADGVWN